MTTSTRIRCNRCGWQIESCHMMRHIGSKECSQNIKRQESLNICESISKSRSTDMSTHVQNQLENAKVIPVVSRDFTKVYLVIIHKGTVHCTCPRETLDCWHIKEVRKRESQNDN